MPKLALRTTLPRPTDPDIIERFATATRRGHPTATAATLAGIEQSTATRWLALGAEEREARTDGELGSHVAFFMEHKRALAAMVDDRLGVIEDAAHAKGGWVPAMTLLERRMPRDFGRNERLEIEQRVVNVNISASLGPGQRAALLAQLQEQATDDNSAPDTLALPPPADTNDNA